MRIVCIGGGPAGLYFALLMKKQHPEHQVTVVERNRPYDTFGWGVVFSDATMQSMREWDPQTAETIEVAFNHWDDIELIFKGRKIRTSGHGFVGIGRKKMLNILQERCMELGVELVFEHEVQATNNLPMPTSSSLPTASTRKSATDTPMSSSRTWSSVPTGMSGSARTSASMPSPSISSVPNTAGSRRISIASMTTPRPSS